MSQRSPVSGSRYSIKTQRRSPICTGTCILQTGDGPSTSEKQFVPGRIQMTPVISGSPIFQHSVHQATLQIGFLFLFLFLFVCLFVLISEGEDEVKKVQFFN